MVVSVTSSAALAATRDGVPLPGCGRAVQDGIAASARLARFKVSTSHPLRYHNSAPPRHRHHARTHLQQLDGTAAAMSKNSKDKRQAPAPSDGAEGESEHVRTLSVPELVEKLNSVPVFKVIV